MLTNMDDRMGSTLSLFESCNWLKMSLSCCSEKPHHGGINHSHFSGGCHCERVDGLRAAVRDHAGLGEAPVNA